jgi:hypothetical protein
MPSLRRLTIGFIGFIFFTGSLPAMENPSCDVDIKGNEVRIKDRPARYAPYLSDLGLTENQIQWGPAEKGVRMGALFLPPEPGHRILVISIRNESDVPLMLPLLGYFPSVKIHRAGDLLGRALYARGIGLSGAFPQEVHLAPGKMISFGVDNRWDLPMNVPLVVTFKFDGLGFYVLPD